MPEILIYAVPNGGSRNPREAATLRKEGVLPGVPDISVDEPRKGFHGLKIEMKRKDGKGVLSSAQKKVMRQMADRGYACVVCHGADEAWDALQSYLLPG